MTLPTPETMFVSLVVLVAIGWLLIDLLAPVLPGVEEPSQVLRALRASIPYPIRRWWTGATS